MRGRKTDYAELSRRNHHGGVAQKNGGDRLWFLQELTSSIRLRAGGDARGARKRFSMFSAQSRLHA
jgi:hypothetical protein